MNKYLYHKRTRMDRRLRNDQGFALVIVLFACLLCALILMILMQRVTINTKSTSAYTQSAQLRSISDMALNVVQAQIRDATTTNQLVSTPLASRDTWASQPGAIRTYSSTGTLRTIYKLYSSDTMTTTSANLSADVLPGWSARPSEYTDLNEPVTVSGTTYYPIINPDIASLSPGATGIINGFSINSAPLGSGTNPNPIPMPVQWIYVLQDGTLCQLGDSRINRTSNPIVGRLAFWTDDETSKVNINTAAPVTANSFWDAPRTMSNSEYSTFATKQPSQNEYQRYPGHPAMVSLRSILGNLGGLSSSDYYKMTPRYIWGGSEDGAKTINVVRTSLLQNKEDRAYASVDELLFASQPSGFWGIRQSQVSPAQADALNFFLTANSRAPELNLFGQPRVTIWPIHAVNSDTRRTPFDRLIAFCSTLGNKIYYFQRADNMSSTSDYDNIPRNQQLYSYLQSETNVPVPGFPSTLTFSSKYGADRDQILTEIFDYIRITNLNETYTGRDLNFKSYTSEWIYATRHDKDGEIINITAQFPQGDPINGAGLVVPIEIGTTRGMGRFPAIVEAGLMFIKHAQFKPVAGKIPDAPDPANLEQLDAMLTLETITPAFGYSPWVGKDIYLDMTASNLRLKVGSREIEMFPASVQGKTWVPIHYPTVLRGGFTPGGYDGASYIYGIDGQRMSGNSSYDKPFRFMSPPLNLEDGDTTFSVIGGQITLNVMINDTVIQTYTFNFDSMDDLPMPIRTLDEYNGNNYLSSGTPYGRPWWRARFKPENNEYFGPFLGDVLHSIELAHGDARLVAGRKNVPADYFKPHANYHNPVRLAHNMRSTGSSRKGMLWQGATGGTYVDLPVSDLPITTTPANYASTRNISKPKIPSSVTSLRAKWSGDFDNAWYNYLDGPFINKPDEGSLGTSPYSSWIWKLADGLFSPLRQTPSAVMFGSLPTGVVSDDPWQTLLFCANPADPNHKGFSDPRDYLLLDLFRMPVVEPYAISGPASTDGKINMNYAIAPFDYIKRKSAWYALLEPLKLFAIPDSASDTYKTVAADPTIFRLAIDIPQTLSQFDARFSTQDIFRSPSEICSLFLVPTGQTLSGMTTFWNTHRLTGDNSREKPYAELYPKLTTQSNTYRVHIRVQMLPPSDGLPTGKTDFQPLAEYRGSALIERYLNPMNSRLQPGNPGYVDPDVSCLNELYQYRVLETRQFTP